MISIKRFLEQRTGAPGADGNQVESLTQVVRLLLDAMGAHAVRGSDTELRALRRTLARLVKSLERPQSDLGLLSLASDAAEALETYGQRTAEYFREQSEERQSMLAMLTDTVADLSGQTDASVARLQTIEKQVEQASALEDIRSLRANLEDSLRALRDAVAQQRSSTAKTLQRLESEIEKAQRSAPGVASQAVFGGEAFDLVPESSRGLVESIPTAYVAAFRLQRAEHIASRFGEAVKFQMISMIGSQLKTLAGPHDRLLRWKGTSYVMFLYSNAGLQDVRTMISEVISATGQHYIEVGRKSALLSVGVDWILFPQAERPTLEAVFSEVDAFLAGNRPETAFPGGGSR